MCTAISYHTDGHYFGRNLDLDFQYQECVTVAPRNFPLANTQKHYAIIGIATVADGYPLYYDATNEAGLSIAGLNFPGYAQYAKPQAEKRNIPSYDVIPAILANCKSTDDVKDFLQNALITDKAFGKEYPPSPLHWFVADKERAIAVEMTKEGLSVLDNPVGVLTNNPPLPYHLANLSNYMCLTREEPVCRFGEGIALTPFSRGQGAFGLPGDFSSSSRFIRAAFVLHNSPAMLGDADSLSQFFHILSAVQQPDGCVRVGSGFQKTIYSSCCNTETGEYYYTTYHNHEITGVAMRNLNLEGSELITFPLRNEEKIRWETKTGPC